jgi:uncharacterized membrane protein YphA (DoxX/SURF4 family)
MKLIGYVLLVAIFVVSGFVKVANPSDTARIIMSTAFPKAVNELGLPFKFTAKEAELLAQAIGVGFIVGGAAVITGVSRQLGAALLILLLIPITAFVHVNLDNPAKTPQGDMIQVFKNISIIGALWLITFSGSRKVEVKKPTAVPTKKSN